MGLTFVGVSSMMGSVNYLTTIIQMRAPGMTMFRLPMTIWAMFITAVLQAFALPVLTAAGFMQLSDRLFGTGFFIPDGWTANNTAHASGGGHPLCPQATVDDGLLDLCIIPAPQDVVGTLTTLLSGGILGLESISVSARLPWVDVEAPEGLDLNLDGEPLESVRLRISARAGALRVHLPEHSPLLLPA